MRVERFFRISDVEDYDKMDLVLLAMEGKALIWFQWWEEQVPFPTWGEFKEDLMKRFQPGVARNPYGSLLRVKQTSLVLQYWCEFELVVGGVRHLDPEVKVGISLNGLKEGIQTKLKVSQFWTLSTMMDEALELEERNLAWKEGGVGSFHKGLGHDKITSPSKPLGITWSMGGSSSAAYGEQGGRGGAEGARDQRRASPGGFLRTNGRSGGGVAFVSNVGTPGAGTMFVQCDGCNNFWLKRMMRERRITV